MARSIASASRNEATASQQPPDVQAFFDRPTLLARRSTQTCGDRLLAFQRKGKPRAATIAAGPPCPQDELAATPKPPKRHPDRHGLATAQCGMSRRRQTPTRYFCLFTRGVVEYAPIGRRPVGSQRDGLPRLVDDRSRIDDGMLSRRPRSSTSRAYRAQDWPAERPKRPRHACRAGAMPADLAGYDPCGQTFPSCDGSNRRLSAASPPRARERLQYGRNGCVTKSTNRLTSSR